MDNKIESSEEGTIMQDIRKFAAVIAVSAMTAAVGIGSAFSFFYLLMPHSEYESQYYKIANKTVSSRRDSGLDDVMRIQSNDTTYVLTRFGNQSDLAYAEMYVGKKKITEWDGANPKNKPVLSEFTKQYWFYRDTIDSIVNEKRTSSEK